MCHFVPFCATQIGFPLPGGTSFDKLRTGLRCPYRLSLGQAYGGPSTGSGQVCTEPPVADEVLRTGPINKDKSQGRSETCPYRLSLGQRMEGPSTGSG